MDSQLFAIKQLLVLREQIAPFEADFAVVERDLGACLDCGGLLCAAWVDCGECCTAANCLLIHSPSHTPHPPRLLPHA